MVRAKVMYQLSTLKECKEGSAQGGREASSTTRIQNKTKFTRLQVLRTLLSHSILSASLLRRFYYQPHDLMKKLVWKVKEPAQPGTLVTCSPAVRPQKPGSNHYKHCLRGTVLQLLAKHLGAHLLKSGTFTEMKKLGRQKGQDGYTLSKYLTITL